MAPAKIREAGRVFFLGENTNFEPSGIAESIQLKCRGKVHVSHLVFPLMTPIMDNQMETKMEN